MTSRTIIFFFFFNDKNKMTKFILLFQMNNWCEIISECFLKEK